MLQILIKPRNIILPVESCSITPGKIGLLQMSKRKFGFSRIQDQVPFSDFSQTSKNLKRLRKKLDKKLRQPKNCDKIFVCHKNICTT